MCASLVGGVGWVILWVMSCRARSVGQLEEVSRPTLDPPSPDQAQTLTAEEDESWSDLQCPSPASLHLSNSDEIWEDSRPNTPKMEASVTALPRKTRKKCEADNVFLVSDCAAPLGDDECNIPAERQMCQAKGDIPLRASGKRQTDPPSMFLRDKHVESYREWAISAKCHAPDIGEKGAIWGEENIRRRLCAHHLSEKVIDGATATREAVGATVKKPPSVVDIEEKAESDEQSGGLEFAEFARATRRWQDDFAKIIQIAIANNLTPLPQTPGVKLRSTDQSTEPVEKPKKKWGKTRRK